MINGKSVLAIVPARGGSKGLPGKNIRMFCGKPLIAWSIEAGLSSRYVDKLWVSTDSAEIAAAAKVCGAEVPFLRPAELATDSATSAEVVIHAIQFAEAQGLSFDIIALLEPTSPLRESVDIDGALEKLALSAATASVVGVSVVEAVHPAYLFREKGEFLEPYLGIPPTGIRRQSLESLMYIEGSIYVSYVRDFLERKTFYHDRTAGWLVPRYKAIEIDELPDYIAAEALMRAKLMGVKL